jgi:hypothetical protein
MSIGQNGSPTGPKSFHRSNPNSTQFITFGELLKGQNSSSTDQRGPAHKAAAYTLYVTFFSFFNYFVRFLSLRPAKTAQLTMTTYTSNDAILGKVVPVVGPNASRNFQGVRFPIKIPKVNRD